MWLTTAASGARGRVEEDRRFGHVDLDDIPVVERAEPDREGAGRVGRRAEPLQFAGAEVRRHADGDIGVIAEMCDRVCVMYAGEVVERGTLDAVFDDSVHPYTEGLLGSIPDLEDPRPRLQPIEGNVPGLIDAEMDDRCYFADRCPKAMESCLEKPAERVVDADAEHGAKCVLADRPYDPSEALPEDHFGGDAE